jgi:hypothetical protein
VGGVRAAPLRSHSGPKATNPGCARAAPSHLTKVSLPFLCSFGCGGLGAPAAGAALEHVTVVQQAVKHGADGSHVSEQFAPVIDGTI